MSKKRSAATDLNHDNWADEEEPDQAGQFKTASEQQMSERKVIKAKRRTVGGSSSSESLFASFKGFANSPTIQSSPGTFDFLKMLNKPPSDSSIKTNSNSNNTQSDTSSRTKSTSSSSATSNDLSSGKPVNPFANLLGNNSQAQKPASGIATPIRKAEESSTSNSKPPGTMNPARKAEEASTSNSKAPGTLSPVRKAEDASMSNSKAPGGTMSPVRKAEGASTSNSKAPGTMNPLRKAEEVSTSNTKRMRCEVQEEKDTPSESAEKTEAQKVFEEKVKELNIKFVTFIHDKVKLNPYVILFPPLDDYRKYIERYVKEKLETENTRSLEKEGFNFAIPPRGASGSVTIRDSASGETKAFAIGGQDSPTRVNPLLSGPFANKATSEPSSGLQKNFPLSASASTESNGPRSSVSSGGFSSASSNPSEAPRPNAKFAFSSSNKSDAQTSASGKPDGESSKLNFSLTSKSDAPVAAKTSGFAWESKPSEKTTNSGDKESSSFLFGQKTGALGGGFSWATGESKSSESPSATASTFAAKPFSFGAGSTETKPFSSGSTDTTKPFSSGSTETTKPFSSGSTETTKPFSFGFASAPPASSQEEDEDDVLPKEEVKEVVEEDAVFTIKCKIFVMKPDKSYGERGVGKLFVKPIEPDTKAQVIVRTETDTGKIIFNVVVTKQVPLRREKNNLMLVTVPHPTGEENPSPTACLVRVKTPEDAERLLSCLEGFKN